MHKTTPKTGMAKRMREWMRERKTFTKAQLCKALEIPPGYEREKVSMNLQDFLGRGEIRRIATGKYLYNHAWKPVSKASIKPRVLKAMYVSITAFSASDIQRLSEAKTLNYVNKIMRELFSSGYLQKIGRRRNVSGFGGENLYRVVDREAFRKEVL
ncbi:MAG TPA: hypothetical protein VMW42_05790 [Desulfatiglandales bacterium]|nr:hypothetical protein [Desulfatiglandales bacterium]